MASQAQYQAANKAVQAVVEAAIKSMVPAEMQFMVTQYQSQIDTVVASASKAAVDAAEGVQ